ncbi:MAG TPA: alpha/beta hydrolase [Kofleriaceae bacterium]|nr:alpha/beta hydrolase [Kofleriaceae bacterium]
MGELEGVVKRVPVDDVTFAVSEQGHGEPVVFVHGDMSDHRSWGGQLPALSERYRVITYSRRFAWPNPPPPPGAGNPLERHADDLVAILRALDATPAHLVGTSSGAFVCLLAARKAPELVASLTLHEPPIVTLFVGLPPTPGEILRLLPSRPRTALSIVKFGARVIDPATKAFRRGDREAATQIFVGGVVGTATFDKLPEKRREQARANVPALEAMLVHGGMPRLTEADIRAVTVPTLLVAGTTSPRLFVRLIDALDELLPDSERVEIAGGHIAYELDPEPFNRALLAFLANHPIVPGSIPRPSGSTRAEQPA